MHTTILHSSVRRNATLALTLLLFISGCGSRNAQTTFRTPEAAFDALVAAAEQNDRPALAKLLGPGVDELLDSGDGVQDAEDRADFVAAYRAKHSLREDGQRRVLILGEQDTPMPIPAVQRGSDWLLDGDAGADELVYRRLGKNELGAIAVARGFVDAQREYASVGHDGDPPHIYALKLVSDPGLQNGLYWQVPEGEAPSPAGQFVADAAAEGYRSGEGLPYHGYHYRMLFAQGTNANGGAREYFQDGLLTQGFALVAWPAEYGISGVMTFIINQDGVVFQRDLGDATAETVRTMMKFDPDSSWVAITNP